MHEQGLRRERLLRELNYTMFQASDACLSYASFATNLGNLESTRKVKLLSIVLRATHVIF